MTKNQYLGFQRGPRPEQSDQRQPDQAASFSHKAEALRGSASVASRIRFPTGTGIVDNPGLVAFDGFSVFVLEFQELDVDLDLVARHLLLISLGVDLADTCAARQPAEAIAPENAIDPGVGNSDGVITRQIPDDADWPQPVGLAQIQHLLDDLEGRTIGRVLWRRLRVLKACQAVLSISCSPTVETGPTDAEIPAGLSDIGGFESLRSPAEFPDTISKPKWLRIAVGG